MQTAHAHQRGGFQIGLCPLLNSLPWRGGFFRGVGRVFIAGVGGPRLPDLLIGLRRRNLSRRLVGEVIGAANCRCLTRLLISKRVEKKVLLGRRVLL